MAQRRRPAACAFGHTRGRVCAALRLAAAVSAAKVQKRQPCAMPAPRAVLLKRAACVRFGVGHGRTGVAAVAYVKPVAGVLHQLAERAIFDAVLAATVTAAQSRHAELKHTSQ
jgi:hypothetical protein